MDQCVGEQLPLEDRQVVLDGDTARIDGKLRQKVGHRQRLIEIVGFAVERNAQGRDCEGTAQRTAVESGQSRQAINVSR